MSNNKFDIDIEIKDLLWEFMRRWRMLVILAVVCGVGFMAYQYRSDLNSATVTTIKKSQEELEVSMSTQDVDEVIGAVALKHQLDQKSAYMETSEWMQINPYEENAVFLQYYAAADNGETAKEAVTLYKEFVDQAYIASVLAQTGKYELDALYLGELIAIVKEESNLYINAENATESIQMTVAENKKDTSFQVKVCAKERDTAFALAEGVKEALQVYSTEVSAAAGMHQLYLMQETEAVVVDQSLAELQNWNATAIKTISNNIDKMKNEMTGDQITLYTYRTVLDSASDAGVTTTVKEVHISVKHMVIGVLLGIILACVIVCVLYLFAAELRNSSEVKKLYQVKLLGTIDDAAFEKKKLFGFVDRMIIGLQKRGKKKFDYKQQLQMICANIALDCQKNSCKEICISSSMKEAVPQEVFADIIQGCEEKGLTVTAANDLAYQADALETAALHGRVVFVEKKHKSLYDELYREIALCKENDICVLGMIVLGE